MCVKNVYYNTYGDGSQDVTERVETCALGDMCRRPEIREYRRKYRFNKHGDAAEASPYHADQHLRLPPTPHRSKSPSPSRKHKSSSVYINDSKMVDIHSGGKKRHSHNPARNDRERVVLHAPEPPAPRLSRSSTMPVDYTPERTSPRRSREIPIGPVNIFEQLGRRHRSSSSSRDKEHHSSTRPSTYYRQHTRGPSEFVFVDDEREQRERRRAGRRASMSHGHSSNYSSAASAATEDVFTAHPAAPSKKLRWEDQLQAEIAAQNERISARPALHQEVKGILKHPKNKDAEVYEDLRRAVGRMDLLSGGKEHSSSPRRSESDDYDYDADRLRARFGGERKRRSRVMSYGTGVYGYQ